MLNVGDRVRMDTDSPGFMGVANPDLGLGTVRATKGEFLMEGLYVEVDWDTFQGTLVERVAIQALVKV